MRLTRKATLGAALHPMRLSVWPCARCAVQSVGRGRRHSSALAASRSSGARRRWCRRRCAGSRRAGRAGGRTRRTRRRGRTPRAPPTTAPVAPTTARRCRRLRPPSSWWHSSSLPALTAAAIGSGRLATLLRSLRASGRAPSGPGADAHAGDAGTPPPSGRLKRAESTAGDVVKARGGRGVGLRAAGRSSVPRAARGERGAARAAMPALFRGHGGPGYLRFRANLRAVCHREVVRDGQAHRPDEWFGAQIHVPGAKRGATQHVSQVRAEGFIAKGGEGERMLRGQAVGRRGCGPAVYLRTTSGAHLDLPCLSYICYR